MCGIAGFIAKNSPIGNSEIKSMEKLLERISYRGPDNSAQWNDNTVLLGHRRLSIVDLSESGNQPFHDNSQDVHVVFNGEIYNYLELRVHLQKQGYSFESQSDTEVLVKCYDFYGEEFIHHLRGMFAFVLYDKPNNKIIIVRDRIGKKPLYLYRSNDKIVFCSELKYFHAFRDITLTINYDSVVNYFTSQYIPGIYTIYNEVQSIAPGEIFIIDTKTWIEKKYKYWEIKNYVSHGSKYSVDKIDSLISDSVRYRLIADVEIGVLLSGGIDSSLLACYAHELQGNSIKAYSVHFGDNKLDESYYSNLVAKSLPMELISIDGDNINEEIFEKCIFHADQPLGDPAIIPTFMISELLSQYVKVVLSGEGADELFHGYPYYKHERTLQHFEKIISKKIISATITYLSKMEFSNRSYRVAARFQKMREWDLPIGVARWTTVFDECSLSKLMLPSIVQDGRKKYQEKMSAIFFELDRRIGRYNSSTFLDIIGWLPNDLLVKLDRMTMAHGVEARAPFLDQKLIEAVIGMDSKYLLNKKPLRELLKNKLPMPISKTISNRKKHGFEVPTVKWLKGPLRNIAEYSFSKSILKNIEGINPEEAALLWKKFLRSPHPEFYVRRVWLLFCFISWYRQHQLKFGF